MKWVQVILVSNRGSARPIEQRLHEAGIPAKVCGESPLAKLWFVPRRKAGARMMVAAEDFGRAQERLREWDTPGALRDVIRCPECGSLRVVYPQYAEHSLLTNLILGLGAVFGIAEKVFYCEDCHYTWPRRGARPRRNRPHLAPYYFLEGVEQTAAHPPGASPAQEERHDKEKAA